MPRKLSIGDFSCMTFLSVKALRHYQDAGLLTPAKVDETGYRFYELSSRYSACHSAITRRTQNARSTEWAWWYSESLNGKIRDERPGVLASLAMSSQHGCLQGPRR